MRAHIARLASRISGGIRERLCLQFVYLGQWEGFGFLPHGLCRSERLPPHLGLGDCSGVYRVTHLVGENLLLT